MLDRELRRTGPARFEDSIDTPADRKAASRPSGDERTSTAGHGCSPNPEPPCRTERSTARRRPPCSLRVTIPRTRIVAAYSVLFVAISALLLAGCGASEPNRADLPPALAKSFVRLQRAGLDPQVAAALPGRVPTIVVRRDSSHPVLISAASHGSGLAAPALGGLGFATSRESICGRYRAAGPDPTANRRVLGLTGLCGRRGRGDPS
jgi:hypothetical protein